jgi:uncharacterized glyoxalase superfamily protein PhnB
MVKIGRVIPVLTYQDIPAAHDFLVRAFGFNGGGVHRNADGQPVHAEVRAGDNPIWLHRVTAEHRLDSPLATDVANAGLVVSVDDVDAHYERARAAGAVIDSQPVDQPYGQREYGARDLEGHRWWFGAPAKAVSGPSHKPFTVGNRSGRSPIGGATDQRMRVAKPRQGAAMAENQTKATDASVGSYLSAIKDETRRKDCEALAKLMTKATKQKPQMWGPSIVGFGSYHYKYESGREGDACLTGFSSRKGDISVYLGADFPGREKLLPKLGKCRVGGGCLYIRKLSDIDLEVLERFIVGSVAERKLRHA